MHAARFHALIRHRVFAALGVGLALATACRAAERPPNIVFIVADDLGHGDLGCYGQTKIRTPRLDRLAAEGMRLTQHYSGCPVCAPSRCVLMTGLHTGHCPIRNNTEVQPEGQQPLRDETVTLIERFRALGYATGGFGKWGLGAPGSPGEPLRQGFERWFGYNCQRAAHNHFPATLWDDDRRRTLDNPAFAAHQVFPKDADPSDLRSFGRYAGQVYGMDAIMAEALQFVRAHRERPFFLFVPSIIPHLALQAPADALREYAGAFPEQPYLGQRGYLPHPTPRAAYAAMVSRLDQHVGQLLDLIDELELSRNTLVVFTSDNGAAEPGVGGVDTTFFASHGGLRGHKGLVYEGGLRVPALVRWPERIEPATVSERVTGFEDWLPTLLELAGAHDAVPAEIDGLSFAATLLGKSQPERPFLYREFPGYGGQQAVRRGPWKAVRTGLAPPKKAGPPNQHVELYQLVDDPTESRDVSAEHPEIVAQLAEIAGREHVPSPQFPLPALDQATP